MNKITTRKVRSAGPRARVCAWVSKLLIIYVESQRLSVMQCNRTQFCYVYAQRVDNALVSLFSLARALQLPRVKRLPEDDPDFPNTRQDSADWQGLVCSRDEHRYDRDRETRKHDIDSRLEWLKLARARKPAPGEPFAQYTLPTFPA